MISQDQRLARRPRTPDPCVVRRLAILTHRVMAPNQLTRRGALLSVLLSAGCVDESRETITPESLVGCYALARRDSPSVSVRNWMPDTLMLNTTAPRYPKFGSDSFPYVLRSRSHRPDAGRDTLQVDSGAAVPYPPDWERTFVVKVWRLAPDNEVFAVLYQNMGASWDYRFRIRGDSMVGTAKYYDDGPITFDIPLVARRVKCPVRIAKPSAAAGEAHPAA
jgi:hypothetical protein